MTHEQATLNTILAEIQGLAARVTGVEHLARGAAMQTQRLGQTEVIADDTATDATARMLAAMEKAGLKVHLNAPAALNQPLPGVAGGFAHPANDPWTPAPEPRQPAQQQPALPGVDDEHGPLVRRYTLPNGWTLIYHRSDDGLLGGFNLRLQLGNGDAHLLVRQSSGAPE